MTLVKCKECGKEISSKAEVCPHCGKKHKQLSSTGFDLFLIIVVLPIIAAVIILLWTMWWY